MPEDTNTISRPTRSRANLRHQLQAALQTDSELDAFCLDHFPSTHRLFTHSMDRQQKLNLLLAREDAQMLAMRLDSAVVDGTAMHLEPMSFAAAGKSTARRSPATKNLTKGIWSSLGMSAMLLLCLGIGIRSREAPSQLQRQASSHPIQAILHSVPTGAQVWDMRSGRLLGTTPWLIPASLLPRVVCLRHSGSHDELVSLAEGQLPHRALQLRSVGSANMEACDVPIPILP